MLKSFRHLNILSHLKTEVEILAPLELTAALHIFIRVKMEALNCLTWLHLQCFSSDVTFLQNRVWTKPDNATNSEDRKGKDVMDEWTCCKFYLSLTAWRETRGDGERNDKGILNGRNVSFRSASTVTDAWDTLSNKWNWNKESWNSGLAKMEQRNKPQVTNSLMDNLHGIFSYLIFKNVGSQKSAIWFQGPFYYWLWTR